ncbi:MBL fold metallo-hydrolase [Nocardia sp. CDC159]|uniref:MBL fold metallo-hydrolase n=1 Tax=Nocardia pulmonis TaxID=2951408 RepID=A0A9X2J2W6_9NOCA|nr:MULTISPECIES: MBL fold metallo-hydrolase [Nocardia]MCM6778466.1 MBL fold metallo-hydrolase [Nocardia pulmonis]MCM6791355.1 MBL fold metallo-hydrolase [Nocardia sp. CDC159]
MAGDWFAVQRIRDGIYLIAEPMHVNSYLIVGSRRAVLFDSGLGVDSIRRCVETITDRPVLVVNSHHHFDHVGGNHEFEEVAFHFAGSELHRTGPPEHWLSQYLIAVDAVQEQYRAFAEIDRIWFNVLGPEMRMRPFPEHFDPMHWEIAYVEPTRLLQDGEEIDLGDRCLRVVYTPGHSADSICLLDERNRVLFSGDTIGTGSMYAHLATAHIETYALTTAMLTTDIAPYIDDILCAHGARYRAYPEVLRRVADAFEKLVTGSVVLEDRVDCFLDPVKAADFGEFSVFLPPSAGSCKCTVL